MNLKQKQSTAARFLNKKQLNDSKKAAGFTRRLRLPSAKGPQPRLAAHPQDIKAFHIATIRAVHLENGRISGQVDSNILRLRKRQALRSREGTAEPISDPDRSAANKKRQALRSREGTAVPILNPDPDPIMERRETVAPKTFVVAVQQNSPYVVGQLIKKPAQPPRRSTFTVLEDGLVMEAKDRFDDVASGLRVPSVFAKRHSTEGETRNCRQGCRGRNNFAGPR